MITPGIVEKIDTHIDCMTDEGDRFAVAFDSPDMMPAKGQNSHIETCFSPIFVSVSRRLLQPVLLRRWGSDHKPTPACLRKSRRRKFIGIMAIPFLQKEENIHYLSQSIDFSFFSQYIASFIRKIQFCNILTSQWLPGSLL